MMKVLDVFADRTGKELVGLFDESTNILKYITSYDLQQQYKDRIEIQGIKSTLLNSVGKKLDVDATDSIYKRDKYFKHIEEKCVDYEKIKDFTIENIPVNYCIVKDNLLYKFQDSLRMDKCWRVTVFPPYVVKNNKIIIEKELFGYPVKDMNQFFVPQLKYNFSRPPEWATMLNDTDATLDFSMCDFSNIEDISNFLWNMKKNVYIPNFNVSNLHYCGFMVEQKSLMEDVDCQIIELNCQENPFILDGASFVFRKHYGVVLVIVNDNPWLLKELKYADATELQEIHNEQDKEEVLKRIRQIRGKYKLMKRPYRNLLFYALRR